MAGEIVSEVPAKLADEITEALNDVDDMIVRHIEETGFIPTYIHLKLREIAMLFLAGAIKVHRDPQGRAHYMEYRDILVKVSNGQRGRS